MVRHRGVYKPNHEAPYEVSRSRIEAFVKCPACFWLDRVKGIKFPGMPPFLLNSATDTLLKKDFSKYRDIQQPHPLMERHGLGHLAPFKHDDFEKWTQSLQLGFRTYYKPAKLIIGGGVDDIWHDPVKDELFIVDYKSTAGKRNADKTALEEIDLVGHFKSAYKRQMEIYQWIMRQNGFKVSNTGYFVYVNGDQHFEDGMLLEDKDKAVMNFDVQLIPYQGDDSWVEKTILDLKACLDSNQCPDHASSGYGISGNDKCEYATFLEGLQINHLS